MYLLFRELDKQAGAFFFLLWLGFLLLFGLLFSIEGKHLEPYGIPQCLISTSWECFYFPLVCWQCPLWAKCVDLSFGVLHPLVTS